MSESLATCKEQGQLASASELSVDQCPFRNHAKRAAWLTGYEQHQRELAKHKDQQTVQAMAPADKAEKKARLQQLRASLDS